MPYDPALGDNVSIVRFLIQDNGTTSQLADGEITYVLSDEGNVPIRAAIICCRVLAARYNSPTIQLGNKLAADYTSLRTFYLELAKSLERKMARTGVIPYAGGISKTDKQTNYENTDRVQDSFTRDMMTEPGTEHNPQPARAPGDWW